MPRLLPDSDGRLGRGMLPPEVWTEIAQRLRLSPRELQIVQYIFDDKKDHAIADELGISPHTVHSHCERLYRKLNATGRCEVILRVFDAYVHSVSVTPMS